MREGFQESDELGRYGRDFQRRAKCRVELQDMV